MSINLSRVYLLIIFFWGSLFSSQTHYTAKQIDSLLLVNDKPNDWGLEKNVDFLNKLFKEAEKIHYEKGMYMVLTKITGWYMLKGQYKKAFPYFEKIEKLPVKKPENIKYKINGLQSKAFAFSNLGLYDDAQIAIERSMVLANSLKENDAKFRLLGRGFDFKSSLYIEMKKPEDSVLLYLKKAAFQYKKLKNNYERENLLNGTYINISNSFIEAKKPDSALYYSYKAKKSKQLNDQEKVLVFLEIGQVHYSKHNLDSALYYYKKAEMISIAIGNPLDLKEIYQTLTEIYDKSGDKENALLYSKKHSHLSDSLNIVTKQNAATANKSIKETLKKETRLHQKRFYWVIAIIVILLILALVFSSYIFKNYKKERKSRQEKKYIIEEKTKELEEMKSKVNESFEEIVNLAKTNDTTAFLGRFREVYPDFCDKIQQICPDILNSELTFCAYLKLNFSTKEIAAYTFTEARSVQNRKSRLRKRLNIPSDADIYMWIGKI